MANNSMARLGVVHLDPTNPNKIFNPDTGRYVYIDKEIGQSLLRKYGNSIRQDREDLKQSKSIDYDALDIIQNQISQYKEYVAKEPYHDAAEMILDALSEVQKSSTGLQALQAQYHKPNQESQIVEKVQNIIEELIEIFTILKEQGFRMGSARYPGPNTAWKNLVKRYL